MNDNDIESWFKMKQSELNIILKQIEVIKNTKFQKIGRVADMAWLSFIASDKKEYALHLQCCFRIRTNDKILATNLDMYEPATTLKDSPSFDWETFNWDVQGFNRYDEWAKQHSKEKENQTYVELIRVNNMGDLFIQCSHGIIIDIIVNDSVNECWRFFERTSKDDHLVVTGQGLEE